MRQKSKAGLPKKEDKMSLLRIKNSIQAEVSFCKGTGEMKMNKETEQSIAQLQMIEQNVTNLSMQRQAFQGQLLEIENALKETEKTPGPAYRIIGNIMVASTKEEIKKDLESKKEMFELRIKSFEKQEKQLKEKAEQLQSSVLKELKK